MEERTRGQAKEHGIDFQWCDIEGPVLDAITSRSRCCDLVVMCQEPGELDVGHAWPGIDARWRRETTEQDVGDALLANASEHGCGLLVMGAFSHSRVREFILGGVTRHMLTHADLPVIISH